MLDAANKVTLLVNRGGKQLFEDDFAIADAIVRELLVVGEAAKHLAPEFTQKFSHVPWKDVVGMRDWLVHGYSEIDWERVWNTAQKDIPVLSTSLESILNSG